MFLLKNTAELLHFQHLVAAGRGRGLTQRAARCSGHPSAKHLGTCLLTSISVLSLTESWSRQHDTAPRILIKAKQCVWDLEMLLFLPSNDTRIAQINKVVLLNEWVFLGRRKTVTYPVWVIIILKGGPCLLYSRQQYTLKTWHKNNSSKFLAVLTWKIMENKTSVLEIIRKHPGGHCCLCCHWESKLKIQLHAWKRFISVTISGVYFRAKC